MAADTGKQFESALEVIGPTANAIIERMQSLVSRPETVEVQLGIRLNAQVGAVIASTQARTPGQIDVDESSLARIERQLTPALARVP